MLNYLTPILIIVSLGGMAYLFARKQNRVAQQEKKLLKILKTVRVFLYQYLKKIRPIIGVLISKKTRHIFIKFIDLIKRIAISIKENYKKQALSVKKKYEQKQKQRQEKKQKEKLLAEKLAQEKKKKQEQIKKQKEQEKTSIEALMREQKYIKQIAQDPKNTIAYKKLAQVYLQQGDKKHARACWEQVLKINPKDKQAKKKLDQV